MRTTGVGEHKGVRVIIVFEGRDALRREGVEAKAGNINRFTSVADAVDDYLKPPGEIVREEP